MRVSTNQQIIYGDKGYRYPVLDTWETYDEYLKNLSKGVIFEGIADVYFPAVDALGINRDLVNGLVKAGAKNLLTTAKQFTEK